MSILLLIALMAALEAVALGSAGNMRPRDRMSTIVQGSLWKGMAPPTQRMAGMNQHRSSHHSLEDAADSAYTGS